MRCYWRPGAAVPRAMLTQYGIRYGMIFVHPLYSELNGYLGGSRNLLLLAARRAGLHTLSACNVYQLSMRIETYAQRVVEGKTSSYNILIGL